MRISNVTIAAILLATIAAPATAQEPPRIMTGGGCTANCTLTGTNNLGAVVTAGISDTGGITTTGTVNVPATNTTTGGYQMGGTTVFQLYPNTLYREGVFVGPRAGLGLAGTTGGFGNVGVGNDALKSAVSSGAENTSIGGFSSEFITTGSYNTAIGQHAIGYDNPTGEIAIGSDISRDTMGTVQTTVVGSNTFNDGQNPNALVIFGQFDFKGSAGNIEITGTITVGDVLHVTLTTTNANVVGLPITVNYTVVSGDTLASIATNFSAAINTATTHLSSVTLPDGNTSGSEQSVYFGTFVQTPTNYIAFHFPGGNTTGWAISAALSCTGTCTETLTYVNPTSGTGDVMIGNSLLNSVAAQNPTDNVLVGIGMAQNAITGFNSNVLIGSEVCYSCTSDAHVVAVGHNAYEYGSGSSYDVYIGDQAGDYATGGSNNVAIGPFALNSNACITTGSMNLELGADSCVPSATQSNQMSIRNIIYGVNNAARGIGTMSTGQIGIAVMAPNATFTIGDAAGASTAGNHIGFLQTTAPAITNATLDAKASDVAGMMTLTAASPVLTFHVAYATVPHCQVTSPSGTAFTYSVSTSALTLTGGASGNTAVYMCVQ